MRWVLLGALSICSALPVQWEGQGCGIDEAFEVKNITLHERGWLEHHVEIEINAIVKEEVKSGTASLTIDGIIFPHSQDTAIPHLALGPARISLPVSRAEIKGQYHASLEMNGIIMDSKENRALSCSLDLSWNAQVSSDVATPSIIV
eukprot:gnl/TRDRNA2_/TRDRNA2_190083_c0_seq1.p1 gnl/TRDRNA2_/TRDRNA2_190083_c0~~gnl/TRDRNA2_/TRDRNA2_190083_c0_seq1.p1  ORF type:complete len:147 (+),score=16.02 gnl/TRDRNA2_/TRDRNA2_190083_c0_seq1:48-488(+)